MRLDFSAAELAGIKAVLVEKALQGNLRAVQLLLQWMRTPHFKHAENLESYHRLLHRFVRPKVRCEIGPDIRSEINVASVCETAGNLPVSVVASGSGCARFSRSHLSKVAFGGIVEGFEWRYVGNGVPSAAVSARVAVEGMGPMNDAAESPQRRQQPIRPVRKSPAPSMTEDLPPTRVGNRVSSGVGNESDWTAGAPPRTVDAGHASDLLGVGGADQTAPIIPERFSLEHLLGEGGLGCVVAVRDAALRRRVALKYLKDHDDASVARFVEEAQITAQLQHPNIVPIYDLTRSSDGKFLLAMKPVEGKTFSQVIHQAHQRTRNRGVGSELRRLLEIFLKVCDGVAYAHSQGVIHRDLKPDNVMVGEFGEVLVMDWGLAKPTGHLANDSEAQTPLAATVAATTARKRAASHLQPGSGKGPRISSDRREAFGDVTVQGQVQGTIAYMAPEQARGSQNLDEGCDIFALGGILYTILTYRWPIEGRTEEDMLGAALDNRIIPPRQRAPRANIPAELEAVAMKAMARRRNDRFAAVADLRHEIERFLDGRLLHSARYAPWVRLAKWVRRHPTLSVTAGATGGLATIAVLAVVMLLANLRDFEQQAEIDRSRMAVAEAQSLKEAADRARAEAEADAQKQRALAAEAATTAAQVERDRARDLINRQSQAKRSEIIEEFSASWAESNRRAESSSMFAVRIGATKLQEYLGAYDRLIDEVAPTTGLVLTAQDFMHRGLLRYLLLKSDGSLADMNRALELDPQFTQAMNLRGMIIWQRNDLAAAIAEFDRALAFEPDNPGILQSRGTVKMYAGDMRGALADFDRAVQLNPNSANAFNNRATLKSQMRDFPGSIADYDRSLQIAPEAPLTYNNRGVSKLQANDLDGAFADFEMCLKLMPQFADAYDNRGMVKHLWGQVDEALADFERASNLNPQLISAHLNCAQVYFARENFSRAIEFCTRALEVDANQVTARLIRGMAHYGCRDFTSALADVDAVLQTESQVWQAWHTRGLALLELGRTLDAHQSLHTAHRFCPHPAQRDQIAETIRRFGGTPPNPR